MSRIELCRKDLLAIFFISILAKKDDSQENFVRHFLANIARMSRKTNLGKFSLVKKKGKEGPRELCKFRKIAKVTRIFLVIKKDSVTNIAKMDKERQSELFLNL